MKRIYLVIVLTLGIAGAVFAQSEAPRVAQLEGRVSLLEHQARDTGLVLFLFGTVCALWAQNSGRSGWLWFFIGLFFSVIAVLVLLAKNSGDIDRRHLTDHLRR
jgi:cell division protein FtsW (lipid II flippase)